LTISDLVKGNDHQYSLKDRFSFYYQTFNETKCLYNKKKSDCENNKAKVVDNYIDETFVASSNGKPNCFHIDNLSHSLINLIGINQTIILKMQSTNHLQCNFSFVI